MATLVLLGYSADMTNIFPWIVTSCIIANLVASCDLGIATNMVPNKVVKNLNGRDCDTSNYTEWIV